jgi:hypothetical protein
VSTPTTTDHQTAREAARRERVDAIRDAAIVREHLGQAASHRRLPDGAHEVSFFDRERGELLEFTGATADEAIARARRAQR